MHDYKRQRHMKRHAFISNFLDTYSFIVLESKKAILFTVFNIMTMFVLISVVGKDTQ